jgi:hypothetical protein
LPEDKRLSIGHRWDKAMKESDALKFMLDSIEKQEREETHGSVNQTPERFA